MRRQETTRMIHKPHSNKQELYISSCEKAGNGGGIYKYSLSDQGKLKYLAYLPCDQPMYAVSENERLHILLRAPFEESENSGYFSCKSNFSDRSQIQNTLGKVACHIAADRDVYITNYLSGNIVKNCKQAVFHDGYGVNVSRQEMAHTHFAAISSDHKYVLCCDLGTDTIFIYDRNLNEISKTKVPDGYGVRHLVFSEDKKFFYTSNELVPSVSVFEYANGNAKPIKTYKLPCRDKKSTAAAIRLAEGKNLYVSVRGENSIFAFDVKAQTLQLRERFSCNGDSPKDFNIVDDFIVCANENSDNIVVFQKYDLTVMDTICLKSPVCITIAN